jgi:hypothetical protein
MVYIRYQPHGLHILSAFIPWFRIAFLDKKAVYLYSKIHINSYKSRIYIHITTNMYKNIVFLYILKKRAYDQITIT